MIEGLETDPDVLAVHFLLSFSQASSAGSADYACDRGHDAPAPTVRPPSRMAKRSFSSIAIGTISSTSMVTLSPGHHHFDAFGQRAHPGHVRRVRK